VNVLPTLRYKIITADTAQKTKTRNDYTVMQCWGATLDGKAILIDQIRGKYEAPELLTMGRAFFTKHRDGCRGMWIEDKVSGTGLIQQLQREGVPVNAIQRTADKEERAHDITPYLQAGHVLILDAPYVSDLTQELILFPEGVHDDQVDTFVDGVKVVSGFGIGQSKRESGATVARGRVNSII